MPPPESVLTNAYLHILTLYEHLEEKQAHRTNQERKGIHE